MKYRVTITLKTNKDPDYFLWTLLRDALDEEGEELIDIGIVPLEDQDSILGGK